MAFFYERHREASEPSWGRLPMRLAWVFKTRPSGERLAPAAKARCFWHSVVRGNVYESCGQCGRPVGLVWSAPKDLWREVHGQDGGVRCIPCFNAALEARDTYVAWVPIPIDDLTRQGGYA